MLLTSNITKDNTQFSDRLQEQRNSVNSSKSWYNNDFQPQPTRLNLFYKSKVVSSLRKRPFLLALRRWGRFARRNVCDLATEIPY